MWFPTIHIPKNFFKKKKKKRKKMRSISLNSESSLVQGPCPSSLYHIIMAICPNGHQYALVLTYSLSTARILFERHQAPATNRSLKTEVEPLLSVYADLMFMQTRQDIRQDCSVLGKMYQCKIPLAPPAMQARLIHRTLVIWIKQISPTLNYTPSQMPRCQRFPGS